MLARSFRLVAARLVPRRGRPKRAALILVPLILAACGGSSAPKAKEQRVSGAGFRFQAPAGWHVRHAGREVSAASGSELVKVATFVLVRPYTDALFARVNRELTARMRQVATETGGKLSAPSTVTAGGIRSHAFRVTTSDHVDQYTFVLRGKREYQLLCRRSASHRDSVCERLIASFQPV